MTTSLIDLMPTVPPMPTVASGSSSGGAHGPSTDGAGPDFDARLDQAVAEHNDADPDASSDPADAPSATPGSTPSTGRPARAARSTPKPADSNSDDPSLGQDPADGSAPSTGARVQGGRTRAPLSTTTDPQTAAALLLAAGAVPIPGPVLPGSAVPGSVLPGSVLPGSANPAPAIAASALAGSALPVSVVSSAATAGLPQPGTASTSGPTDPVTTTATDPGAAAAAEVTAATTSAAPVTAAGLSFPAALTRAGQGGPPATPGVVDGLSATPTDSATDDAAPSSLLGLTPTVGPDGLAAPAVPTAPLPAAPGQVALPIQVAVTALAEPGSGAGSSGSASARRVGPSIDLSASTGEPQAASALSAAAAIPVSVAPAIAPTVAAALVGATPDSSTPGDVPAQISAALIPLRGHETGTHQLVVQLHPADLGPVNLIAHLEHGSITVELTSTSEQAHEAMANALPTLHRNLQEAGYATVNVSMGSASTGADTSGGGFAGDARPDRAPVAPVATPIDTSIRPASRTGPISSSDAALDRWL